MLQITNKFLNVFLERKVIDEDMADVYRYGLEILFSSLFTTFSILVISFLLNSLGLGVLYLFLTIPLKLTAGGYHADTYKKCFLISNLTFTALIYVYKIISYYHSISVIFWLIILYCSTFYIFLKAPVQNIHQPLSPAKIERNKRRTRIYLLIDCCAITLLAIIVPASGYILFSILCILLVALFIIPTQRKGGPSNE
ncbi:MAG: accessory gene regulator B family protein [Lachnospiraceae bacterium]